MKVQVGDIIQIDGGSEGYQSVKMGRKFIGVELKASYYKQARLNLKAAEEEMQTIML